MHFMLQRNKKLWTLRTIMLHAFREDDIIDFLHYKGAVSLRI